MEFNRIIISRTDSIGDVVLTLPMAGWLRGQIPGAHIAFLGASYTRAVVEACAYVDEFLSWDEAGKEADRLSSAARNADLFIHVFPRKEIAVYAKKMKVAMRLGTTNRLYHWHTCNKLVAFSRRRSDLHESQLNFRLLEGLTGKPVPGLGEIAGLYGLERTEPLNGEFASLLDPGRFNLILHPKSRGSAREWGLDNFRALAGMIPAGRVKVFISGTETEGRLMREAGFFDGLAVTDLTGRMSLSQFISFIRAADGLVAASTGPLHLAAAQGKHAIGLYPPIRPMDPGRWAPVGKNASYLVVDKNCDSCRNGGDCECLMQITPSQVLEKILQHL